MLQEAIDLQQNAVAELVRKVETKREITFRAPTGSGKTRMMADFMNRILIHNQDVIFLVSTLSKGDLAEQNYNAFKDCADKNIFLDFIGNKRRRKFVYPIGLQCLRSSA